MQTHKHKAAKIVVVGSVNMDLLFKTPRMPAPGETLMGQSFHQIHGGKGANQAVAAARLGGEVSLIACVGQDDFGRSSVAALQADGIDTQLVRQVSNCATGVAGILLDDSGENSIVLAAGANAEVQSTDIDAGKTIMSGAQFLVCQLETPMASVAYAIQQAKTLGLQVILNPAPMQDIATDLLNQVDFLVLNETETQQMTGMSVENAESAVAAAQVLRQRGVGTVIVTLGAAGVVVVTAEGSMTMPAYKVEVLDTTAAGDTFVGALAVALGEGEGLQKACDFAQRAAAIAVTQLGAQTSIPHRSLVESHFH
ncbi:ribokinase [Undibacterium cyanobacteriorum]|uniref:Ribokinase n=1 Tax=Undibacterium cyanobacteriorum TaxID=3073561 RepID=A0ABY9RK90_9BURK|nr:ribokinase [Undibacterium sp. 20NA77.5]WMW81629.1 ribokinase [Undibacterium sp. 20NA77.5]